MSAKNKNEVKTEAVEVEVKTEEAPVSEKKPEKKKSNVVYLGPTITGVVRHSEVFAGGELPEKAAKCVSDFPMMARLFVDIDEMAEAVKELRKEKSVLSTIYAQTVNKYTRR